MTSKAERLLERRYRLLLAWYPAAYRDANEAEMLGVAMARSAPGQRWPRPGEAASFVWRGIGKRLGSKAFGNGLRDQAWRDACVVLTVIGPIVLAASAARNFGWPVFIPLSTGSVGRASAETAAWLLLGVLAAVGLRRTAALGVLAALVAEIALHTVAVPFALVRDWWLLVLAFTTACAALVALGGDRHRVLSRRAVIAVIAAMTLPAAYPAIERALTTTHVSFDGSTFSSNPLFGWSGLVDTGLRCVACLVTLVVIIRLVAEVRRRVIVALLPALALFVVVFLTYNGFLDSTVRFYPPVALQAVQLAALVAVPFGCLGLGLLWLVRYERMLRRIATADARDGTADGVTQ